MATIQDYLSKILKSRYGRDVRQAIHDGIQQCYYDGKAGSTDLEARQRLDNAEADINQLSGATTAQAEQITQNTKDINRLSGEIADLKENGVGSSVEPAEDDIPKVFINGEIPTDKNDVLAELDYVSKTETFHAYIEIKCQGDSSLSYAKKNFTVKMFSDEARETKLKKAFKDWGEHNKYVLKANFVDHTHARNIVSAKLWSQVVASRSDYDSLPDGLKASPNNGAIEGFPIKVYNNGTYQGIYTLNIPKDDWLYGVDEDNPNQFVLYGQHNTNGTYAETANNFRALWDGVSQSDGQWEVEVGTNSDIVKTALNNVISLCMNADDATFKSTLNNYLDVQSALDYYIFCYTICALDSLAQNMILVSYDGTKLYCSAYDLDSTFGLWWNGQSFVSASYRCPEDYQESYSLLWERIENLFADELKARYAELRRTVLSLPNMFTLFERFMDVIGLDLYAEDLTVYSDIPSGNTNNITQIRNYIRDRLVYCDVEFANMGDGFSGGDVLWSYTTTNKIDESNGAVSTSGGDAYLSKIIEIPDNATSVILKNINGATYIYKELYVYDTNMSYIGKVFYTIGGDEGTTRNSIAKRSNFPNMKYIRATAFPNGVATNNDPNNQLEFEFAYEYDFLSGDWSDTATNKIDNTDGAVSTSGGDAYLSTLMEIPDDVTSVTLKNINGATYTYKEIYVYDTNMTYVGKTYYANGGDAGTISDSVATRSIFPDMKYIRATAYPNGVATNNDPNNQLQFIIE